MKPIGEPTSSDTETLEPAQLQALLSMLQKKDERLESQEEKIQTLQQQLDWFKRQLFGQTSEKKDFTDSPYQSTIAELFEALPLPINGEPPRKMS